MKKTIIYELKRNLLWKTTQKWLTDPIQRTLLRRHGTLTEGLEQCLAHIPTPWCQPAVTALLLPPAVLGSWKQAWLLQRWNSDSSSNLVFYHRIPPGFAQWCRAPKHEVVLPFHHRPHPPPPPCFTLCLVHAVSLQPHPDHIWRHNFVNLIWMSGRLWQEEGQLICPEAAQGRETNCLTQQEREKLAPGLPELSKHCKLQFTLTLNLPGQALGPWEMDQPLPKDWGSSTAWHWLSEKQVL